MGRWTRPVLPTSRNRRPGGILPSSRRYVAGIEIPLGVVEVVNAALYLRRPILVTGDPGVGKSSLAYSIAHELGLGQVLSWNINSRSTLSEGLYQYDAIARLRDVSFDRRAGDPKTPADLEERKQKAEDIGRYIKLGPLGTAYVATGTPRVVLIDEIDKSDIDLPNDLLHVFENGEFEIPELVRMADANPRVSVTTGEVDENNAPKRVDVNNGRVQCTIFPFVVITSNGERELPPAFLRRCLRVDIPKPGTDQLSEIATAHLPTADAAILATLIGEFDRRRYGRRDVSDRPAAQHLLPDLARQADRRQGAGDPGVRATSRSEPLNG